MRYGNERIYYKSFTPYRRTNAHYSIHQSELDEFPVELRYHRSNYDVVPSGPVWTGHRTTAVSVRCRFLFRDQRAICKLEALELDKELVPRRNRFNFCTFFFISRLTECYGNHRNH